MAGRAGADDPGERLFCRLDVASLGEILPEERCDLREQGDRPIGFGVAARHVGARLLQVKLRRWHHGFVTFVANG